jgi:hypothetical protein
MSAMNPITEATHRLCAALHGECIDPSGVEIHLPFSEWWKLYTRIEQLNRGSMSFDGRGSPPAQFQYMGIVYKPKGVV